MRFPLENRFAIDRAEPWTGIRLGQGQLIGNLEPLKRGVAPVFVITDPTAMRRSILATPARRPEMPNPPFAFCPRTSG